MTGWYVATGVRALEHPVNEGDDLRWVCVWLAFVVVVVLSHLLRRRRLITLIWLGLLIAVAIAMTALSGQLVAVLITVWLLLLGWAWGDWTLKRLGVGRSPLRLDSAVMAIPLGLALMALVALALGLTHRLTSKWTWVVFSVLTLIQAKALGDVALDCYRRFISRGRSSELDAAEEGGVVGVLLGFVFLLDLSWALAPEVQFDALAAHLPVAKYYAENSVTSQSYGWIANLVDVLFALALSLQGQIVAKLLVLSSCVLTTLSLAEDTLAPGLDYGRPRCFFQRL
jgi:hypothetical protein